MLLDDDYTPTAIVGNVKVHMRKLGGQNVNINENQLGYIQRRKSESVTFANIHELEYHCIGEGRGKS